MLVGYPTRRLTLIVGDLEITTHNLDTRINALTKCMLIVLHCETPVLPSFEPSA